MSAGNVLVHRPYFEEIADGSKEHNEQVAGQRFAAINARNFLLSRGVSSGLVDKVMSLPSSRAYALTNDDYNDLGYMAPVAEEQAIRRCSIDNRTFLRNYTSNVECLEAIFIPLRNAMIEQILGAEALASVRATARALYLNEIRSNAR